jgi:P-loop containing dynein motor region D4
MPVLMLQAGAAGKPTVFLVSDTQLKEEGFLEDINQLLNTGVGKGCWLYMSRHQY